MDAQRSLNKSAESNTQDLDRGDAEFFRLTIVAAGTRAPELFASIAAIRRGSASMAVGNVVGSNLFNTIAIVGAAALVKPLRVDLNELRTDLILNLVLALSICFLLLPKLAAGTGRLIGVLFIATYFCWLASVLF